MKLSRAGSGARAVGRRTRIVGVAAVVSLLVAYAVVVLDSSSTATNTTPQVFEASTQQSFAGPALNAHSRKVFAHYFPPMPISIDNRPPDVDYYQRNYLSPEGEGSKFAQVGGLLRDRPLPREPRAGNWKLEDLKTEVRQAADAGIDGFTVNIMSYSGRNWETTVNLMRAAAESGRNFTVVPNLDATSGAVDLPVETVASRLADLYRYPSAYKVDADRYLLSSFKAEGKSVDWWKSLLSVLAQQHGIEVAFVAVLLDPNVTNMRTYAPISYALGDFGTRTPTAIVARTDRAAIAHSLKVKWMAGIGVQDVRPTRRIFAEAGNTETLRDGWKRVISDGADMVQLVTWNDYSEATAFAPSVAHGWSFLDINAYYLTKFKDGQYPAVTHDGIYLTHRIQMLAAVPTYSHLPMLPLQGANRTAPRDTVEVLTFLTAPSEVSVTIGTLTHTYRAPAGAAAQLFPLTPGRISAAVRRADIVVSRVASPYTVTLTPRVQDLQYYASSSRIE